MGAKAMFVVIVAFLAGSFCGIAYATEKIIDDIGELIEYAFSYVGIPSTYAEEVKEQLIAEYDVSNFYMAGFCLGLISLGLAAWIKEK